jgi:acetoin utilization deacetylase AcuC-like enzyme
VGDGLLLGVVADSGRHHTGYGHPERAHRIEAAEQGIVRSPVGDAITRLAPRAATLAELQRVHDPGYLDALVALCHAGGGELDPDTPVAAGSWDTAVEAAGLGLAAADALRDGEGAAAFVLPRPPGHHATRTVGMGFCLLNNVAVTAAALAATGDRVLIVDWDVHHGNGTQAIFWDDPDVVYVSTHEWPAYPGTGRPDETGGPDAADATVNVPLPAGATGDVVREAFDRIVTPLADRFRADWVLISAGFDAHRDDPMADLCLSAGDYTDLTRTAMAWAPPGRTIAFLEGGYDLDALARSAGATAAALLGTEHRPEPATSGGPGHEQVLLADRARAHWQAWA